MANKLNVNPTRQELLKLKKKEKTAKRGHKLLKEKRDGLMKEFLKIVREVKILREEIEIKLADAFQTFLFASAMQSDYATEEALLSTEKKISLNAVTKNVMSVHIPVFTYEESGDYLSYSLASTSIELDKALKIFSETLKDLVVLAEKEHSAKLLAAEIEKTRRRVNALEYVFIPDIEETSKFIRSKLNEQERGTIVSLMKIKAMMEAQEVQSSSAPKLSQDYSGS